MALNTSPDNIPYPTTSDNLTPLATWFANIATGVQTAITNLRTQLRSNSSTFPASPVVGQRHFRTDRNMWYTYNGTAWIWDYGIQVRRWSLTRSAIPNGGIGYYLAASTEQTAFRTPTFPDVTYSSGNFTLTSPGLYRVTAYAYIVGANGGNSAQIQIVDPDGSGTTAVLSGTSLNTIQAATTSWIQASTGTSRFRIDVVHNSGAPRDVIGHVTIERIGVL